MTVQERTTGPLTTEAGAPVADNQQSQTAGPGGPSLIQDQLLIEKLAHFNRERIPERIVHARGAGAYGTFTVTADVTRYTRAKFLSEVGKQTETFLRFSTVAGNLGAPDAVRDPRGFALKFYTEDGNYDLVGNNTPVFFIRDAIKFPDFIHTQKRDPYTGSQEADNVWDFWGLSPESTHQVTWLLGDRGIPASYRHMNGYGSHTFQWNNEDGEVFWVKYHFKTDQGIQNLTNEEAEILAGKDPDSHQRDLREAIERGDHPSWTVQVQIMPAADAPNYRFNPFDLTKVWPHDDYPPIEIGKLELNRNPENIFAEVEQSIFSPHHFVPGIGPSPDKMLQGRLFSYGDAHRYRVGINADHLPVNRPHATNANTHGRDGVMYDGRHGGRKNYEPNSFDADTKQTDRPLWEPVAVSGVTGDHVTPSHAEDDDFVQAGNLYRLMPEDAKQRLIDTAAGFIAKVSRDDIAQRAIENFRKADEDYGKRLEAAVQALRG
ncbi:catalase [Streptomyces sp. Amel2xB2]|uniref:Catalase n=1 Tax=Streptomyces nanshensis TaxID=518642 RepID=A0A1E7L5B8_9ACTN|nr:MULTISPECIES: catalase [Streptomyces]OEV11311.1 catalase [Streptomyces nanshensis]RAJ71457.1 catalase [Streptomyces sp. Amel2xB2]